MKGGIYIRKALRLIMISGVTLALSFYGLTGATGTLTRLLVFTGVIALGLLSAKVWPEQKPGNTPIDFR
jgi:hypothetical protein